MAAGVLAQIWWYDGGRGGQCAGKCTGGAKGGSLLHHASTSSHLLLHPRIPHPRMVATELQLCQSTRVGIQRALASSPAPDLSHTPLASRLAPSSTRPLSGYGPTGAGAPWWAPLLGILLEKCLHGLRGAPRWGGAGEHRRLRLPRGDEGAGEQAALALRRAAACRVATPLLPQATGAWCYNCTFQMLPMLQSIV
jgi:hypothetical protein